MQAQIPNDLAALFMRRQVVQESTNQLPLCFDNPWACGYNPFVRPVHAYHSRELGNLSWRNLGGSTMADAQFTTFYDFR
jgi:hypothetical protein